MHLKVRPPFGVVRGATRQQPTVEQTRNDQRDTYRTNVPRHGHQSGTPPSLKLKLHFFDTVPMCSPRRRPVAEPISHRGLGQQPRSTMAASTPKCLFVYSVACLAAARSATAELLDFVPRNYSGAGNNIAFPSWGSAGITQVRTRHRGTRQCRPPVCTLGGHASYS